MLAIASSAAVRIAHGVLPIFRPHPPFANYTVALLGHTIQACLLSVNRLCTLAPQAAYQKDSPTVFSDTVFLRGLPKEASEDDIRTLLASLGGNIRRVRSGAFRLHRVGLSPAKA